METASKVNESEQVQAFLKLYSDYFNRLKKLKDGKEDEKKRIDSKLKDIARTLRDLKSSGTITSNQYKLQQEEEKILIEKITKINTDLKTIKEQYDTIEKSIRELKVGSNKNQFSDGKLENIISEYQKIKYTIEPNQENSSGGCGGGVRKHNNKRNSKRLHPVNKKQKYRYKTRRRIKNKIMNKTKSKKYCTTLRRLKNRNRKKKYTIRRRRV